MRKHLTTPSSASGEIPDPNHDPDLLRYLAGIGLAPGLRPARPRPGAGLCVAVT
jgi:hypothetical protein